jgi:glutaminyl-tRNA synthetase
MTPPDPMEHRTSGRDFIRQIIDRDLSAGRYPDGIVTRFPPEPNGFLHIGHAKSIVLNFGIAEEFSADSPGGGGGEAGSSTGRSRCHLRFDDTNPTTEDVRYVEAIQEDVRWLGYDWKEHLYFASDYFEAMYEFAEELIAKGLAYVDSQSDEAIREGRGTVTEPGRPSPFRTRTVEENLALFRRMRDGEFPNGAHVLRARIDMASPNMLMRDPVLYRIRHAEHYRTGNAWCIYPLYDFAHPLEDALEGVTHSLCTLEFENNRELYDWVVEHTSVPSRPRQYEFARLNLDYTVMSKRKLLRLVQEGDVSGWDDPRMLTIAGLRRRGFTPEAIRAFCEMIGVARSDSRVDMGKLEYSIRDDLNRKAPRVLCVLRPLKVVVTNWPVGKRQELDAPHFPHDVPLEGSRTLPFTRELLIEREDFAENPPRGFRRLVPGGEVRLRYAYVLRCDEVVKDDDGEVVELRCSVDPATLGENVPSERRVKGTIHWVSAPESIPCQVRLYDRLFTVPDPDAAVPPPHEGEAAGEGSFRHFLNPESLEIVEEARVEPSVLEDPEDTRYQFERVGYFWRDPQDSTGDRPVFNRIVTLRDAWSRTLVRDASGVSRGDPEDGGGKERPRGDVPSGPGERPPVPPQVQARADALQATFGLSGVDAEILARDPAGDRFYRDVVDAYSASAPEPDDPRFPAGAGPVANWLIHDLPAVQGDRPLEALPFAARELARLVALVETGTVSSSGGKEVLEVLAREGGDPDEIVARLDLVQLRDESALGEAVDTVLAANPGKVTAYRGGKSGLLGFFMGQVMRATDGKADPEMAKELLRARLDAPAMDSPAEE